MVILFCLYLLLPAKGAPLPHANGENISSSCNTLDNCRTLWDIVWSSLTTIGLCTWSALHPNIPPQFPDEEEKEEPAGYWKTKECWIRRTKKCWRSIQRFIRERVVLLVVALLVPEYILAWAIRQNLMARKIVEKGFRKGIRDSNEKFRLSMTQVHGFFIVMGGFHLYKTRVLRSANESNGDQIRKIQELGVPLYPLTYDTPWVRIGDKEILWNLVDNGKIILPTEDEIQDRSKSDWLAKSLVIFQTLWFVMQCIARGVRRLPVTELEIVALAYTTINLGIYIVWWNKPRGINHPIRVFNDVVEEERSNEALEDEKRDDDSNKHFINPRRLFIWMRLKKQLVKKLFHYIAGNQDDVGELELLNGVPTFWAGDASGRSVVISDSLALLFGIVFGGVHCIAWFFSFPSNRIMILWRLSALAIVGLPVLVTTLFGIALVLETGRPGWLFKKMPNLIGSRFTEFAAVLIVFLSVFSGFLYVIARGTTLVLAFTTLKHLPPGAYQTVQWTNFVPHI